jgi:hypothetical protein
MLNKKEVIIIKGQPYVVNDPKNSPKAGALYGQISSHFNKKHYSVTIIESEMNPSPRDNSFLKKLSPNTRHIIAHSYGSQMVSMQIKEIQEICTELSSIILLDPTRYAAKADYDFLPVFTFWSKKWKDKGIPNSMKREDQNILEDDHYFSNSLSQITGILDILTP